MIDQDQEYVLKFDGNNDYLELMPNFSGFETGITIEFLAKGYNGLTQKATIIEGYNSENQQIFKINLPYYKQGIGGNVSWQIGNDQGIDILEKKVKSREYRIWTYWTFVKDFAQAKMYIYHNGKLWHQGDCEYCSMRELKRIVIGSSEGKSQFWKGHLSEFRIWNKICQEEEIRESRNDRLTGNELGLSVYLPLNGDVNDYSGNGNHATIYSASWLERKIPMKVEQLPDKSIRNLAISEAENALDDTDNLPVSEGEDLPEETEELETLEVSEVEDLPEETEESESLEVSEGEDLPEETEESETLEVCEGEDLPEETEESQTLEVSEGEDLPEETEESESLEVSEGEDLPEEIEESNYSIPLSREITTSSATQAVNGSVPPKKRLVICCDGTWNDLSNSYPTNVMKFARLIKYITQDNTSQLVFYLPGLGTTDNLLEKLGGGAFGWGIDQTIQEAYRLLCMNYDATAQDEIYLLGFSRGAYIVRCLAGMIYNCGLLRRSKIGEIPKAYEFYRNHKISPNDPELQQFRQDNSKKIETETQKSYLSYRVPIKMLGCWDTVGALGVPDLITWLPLEKFFNRKYAFYDASLSPIIENAFQAIAIDEKRRSFISTPMIPSQKNCDQKVEEVWFAGTHGCIGGGTKEYQGLSDYTLQWMVNKAKKLGLEFDSTENDQEEFQIKLDPTIPFDNSVTGIYTIGGEEWRPIDTSNVFVHYSVVERLKALPQYRPENLKPLLNNLLNSEENQT